MDEHSPTTASRIFPRRSRERPEIDANDKSRQVRNAERQTVSDLGYKP
jgi:hypothetical protein